MLLAKAHTARALGILRTASLSGKSATLLASWFLCGLFPFAPGTAGTLGAIPLAWLSQGSVWGWVLLVGFVWLSIASSGYYARIAMCGDPSEVVIDEVAGFLLTMLLLPHTWVAMVLGFFLFRGFDILKPFPANRAEELAGGLGIVMDDLIAGLYAALATHLLLLWLG